MSNDTTTVSHDSLIAGRSATLRWRTIGDYNTMTRSVEIQRVWLGSTNPEPDEQWFVDVYDPIREGIRTIAVARIESVHHEQGDETR